MSLLVQYIILSIIIIGGLVFSIWYHQSIRNNIQHVSIIEPEDEENGNLSSTNKNTLNIDDLYQTLCIKYSIEKASNKKTYLNNKKILKKVETAYKQKDLDTLIQLSQ